MNDFCDICGKASGGAGRYHPACLRRLFGTPASPAIELTHGDVLTKAQEMAGRMSISGVQPKLAGNKQQSVVGHRLGIGADGGGGLVGVNNIHGIVLR